MLPKILHLNIFETHFKHILNGKNAMTNMFMNSSMFSASPTVFMCRQCNAIIYFFRCPILTLTHWDMLAALSFLYSVLCINCFDPSPITYHEETNLCTQQCSKLCINWFDPSLITDRALSLLRIYVLTG